MITNLDIYAVLLLAKKSQFTRFFVSKIFGPKIRSCKFFDKSQVCSGQTILKHVAFSCDEQSNEHFFCYVSPMFPVLGGSKDNLPWNRQ